MNSSGFKDNKKEWDMSNNKMRPFHGDNFNKLNVENSISNKKD